MSFLWNKLPAPVFTSAGQFAAGAQALFYNGGTTTPLTVYQDPQLTFPHAIPVVASQLGIFSPIYIPYGTFRARVLDSDGAVISDADNIDNPAPPSSGGGIVVTSDQILQTGDVLWRLRTGSMQGFVRMNGRTIGSATSGATEFASSSAQAGFEFLWNNLPDSIAPVSSGRGPSAPADFTANKTIVVPSMRGRVLFGIDDMGNSEEGTIQAVTTCTTNNTTTVVVVSAAHISVGQNVKIGGVDNGTVVSINGLNVVLSQVAAGAASGVQFRSSSFSDAIQIGSPATIKSVTQISAQMPSHVHAITDTGHTHSEEGVVAVATVTGGAGLNLVGASPKTTGSATTGIIIQSTGGGQPMSAFPPGRLGTYYMKL